MIAIRRYVLPVLATVALFSVAACGPKADHSPAAAPAASADAPASEPMAAKAPSASALIAGPEGSAVLGKVVFTQDGDRVAVKAEISGVAPGEHGFHIHEVGDCSAADFTSAGGHFNPADVPHAGPNDAERHAGDLGNLTFGEDGKASLSLTSSLITVGEGPTSVVGRAVILHEGVDDMVSQPTGAAGGRIGCGVITVDTSGDASY